jgi:hypothetical protein
MRGLVVLLVLALVGCEGASPTDTLDAPVGMAAASSSSYTLEIKNGRKWESVGEFTTDDEALHVASLGVETSVSSQRWRVKQGNKVVWSLVLTAK